MVINEFSDAEGAELLAILSSGLDTEATFLKSA